MRVLVVPIAGLAAILLAACAVPRPYGEDVGLQALFSGGYRALDHEDFDGHPAYTLEIATREPETGWGYEVGASYGAEDAGGPREHSAEFTEYSFGLRRSWQSATSALQPYLAFGGALTNVDHRLHAPREEFEDDGGAAYVHGGLLWDLGSLALDRGTAILLGFDLRGEAGDDFDYAQLALVLGFGH